jgi:hypothetical protein
MRSGSATELSAYAPLAVISPFYSSRALENRWPVFLLPVVRLMERSVTLSSVLVR